MTNLTADKPRRYFGERRVTSQPMAATDTHYNGAAVQEDGSGYVTNLTGAGTTFLGFAIERGDNAAGGNDDVRIQVAEEGVVELPVAIAAGAALTHIHDAVYATDSDVFTIVSTSAQQIGVIVEIPKASVGDTSALCKVFFQGIGRRSI